MTERDVGNSFLSIIVCTRNRASLLRRALESLVAQEVGSWDWEIIVVDNGSTDATPEVVRSFVSRGPIRYVHEPAPGEGRARNRGLAAAGGSLLAFTDDDVVVDTDWARRIVKRFAAEPAVSAIFGYTYGDPDLSPIFSLHTTPYPYYLKKQTQVWGTTGANNIAFRRAVLNRVGPFDELLGVGAKYKAATDAEWAYRFLKAGFVGIYDPEVRVRHAPGISQRPVEEVILRDDCGVGAWFGKHAVRGDAYAMWMLMVRLGRAVGGRSLLRAVHKDGAQALRLPARRVRVLVHAFLARALDEVWMALGSGLQTSDGGGDGHGQRPAGE